MTFAHLKTKSTYEIVQALKQHERISATALAAQTKYGRTTVVQALRLLHDDKQVHISGWKRNELSGLQMRLYSWGKGKDVPQPMKLKTKKEVAEPIKCDVAAAWMMNPCTVS